MTTATDAAAVLGRRAEAIVIVVGDELLAGAHPDLNGPYLARVLADLGLSVQRLEVHPDDEARIEDAVRRARRDVGWVFVAGGLGPTLDDVTRHGVARALGVGLREDPDTVAALRMLFRDLGRVFPESNRRQALFPEGATILANAAGTAPGFRAGDEDSEVVVLPGPPRELDVVWERQVRPWLAERLGRVEDFVVHRLALFGISESAFAESVGALMERGADPLVGCSAKENTLYITLRSRGAGALERVRDAAAGIRNEFPAELLVEGFAGDQLPRVEDVLGAELVARDVSITVAESCTGGGVAWLLTSVPGISRVFGRSFVTYSNEAKEAVLGVPHSVLETHGAVSGPVVSRMAEGALRAAGADLALAISGIAGPDGGTDEKPVGTIWYGVHWGGRTWAIEHRYPAVWGRERLRRTSRRMALALGLRALRGQPLETAARR